MGELVTIIIVVFGILQIILFFKMWGMTNNVNDIAKKIKHPDFVEKAREAYAYGNEKAAKIFIERAVFLSLEPVANDRLDYSNGSFSLRADESIKRHSKYCEEIGIEIPNFEKYKDREIYR